MRNYNPIVSGFWKFVKLRYPQLQVPEIVVDSGRDPESCKYDAFSSFCDPIQTRNIKIAETKA